MLQLLVTLIETDGNSGIAILPEAAKAAAEFMGEDGADFKGQYNTFIKVKKAHRTARLRLWKFAQAFYVARCSVVASTIGNAVLTEATSSWQPNKLTILFDEACNISEWTLVCLFGAYIKYFVRIVIVGDPEQFPPVVSARGRNPGEKQLEMSLPLRLELSGVETIMLDVQFRCHSEIADIIKSGYRKANGQPGLSSHPANDTRLAGITWVQWQESFKIGGRTLGAPSRFPLSSQ